MNLRYCLPILYSVYSLGVLIVGSDGLRLGSYFSLQRGTAAVTLSGQNTPEEDQDPHSGRGNGGRGLPDR